MVDRRLFVEIKAAGDLHPSTKRSCWSYMKQLLDIPLGPIINFNELNLANDVAWLIIPGVNRDREDRANREFGSSFPQFPFVQK